MHENCLRFVAVRCKEGLEREERAIVVAELFHRNARSLRSFFAITGIIIRRSTYADRRVEAALKLQHGHKERREEDVDAQGHHEPMLVVYHGNYRSKCVKLYREL